LYHLFQFVTSVSFLSGVQYMTFYFFSEFFGQTKSGYLPLASIEIKAGTSLLPSTLRTIWPAFYSYSSN